MLVPTCVSMMWRVLSSRPYDSRERREARHVVPRQIQPGAHAELQDVTRGARQEIFAQRVQPQGVGRGAAR